MTGASTSLIRRPHRGKGTTETGSHQTRRLAAFALACGSFALCMSTPRAEEAVEAVRPGVVVAIERRFGDFFLFATSDGDGFDIYQAVQDAVGLPDRPVVVCIAHQCFFKIATTTKAKLQASEASSSAAFRLVQDNYRLLRRASQDVKPAAAGAWRDSVRRLDCVVSDPAC